MDKPIIFRDPVIREMTIEQVKLLSSIFRIIAKEITNDADKEMLAPGEIGINYTEGIIYIRNPHTGNLVTPNGYPGLLKLLKKIDKENMLNADRVSGVYIYKDVAELDRFAGPMTPDNLIGFGMTREPSVFIGSVQASTDLGWPTENGMLFVYKYDEENVLSFIYDKDTMIRWDGRYDYKTHQFIGFGSADANSDYIEVEGGDEIVVNTDIIIEDLTCLTLLLDNGLSRGGKITVNKMTPTNIVDVTGKPLGYDIVENTTIMLVYDELNNWWVLRNAGDSAASAGIDLLKKRVNALAKNIVDLSDVITKDYETLLKRVAATENKLDNFDAAWIKSINGSKLPLDVLPIGATDRMFRIDSLRMLENSSYKGYPSEVSNGDTIKVTSTDAMYYVHDVTKLGTPDYRYGLEKYGTGMTTITWSNITNKPTSISGYGITDALSKGMVDILEKQYADTNSRMGELEASIQRLNNIIGSYQSPETIANRLSDIEYQPSHLDIEITNWTADGGETGIEAITNFDGAVDKLFLNYNNILLRVGIDYSVHNNGVVFHKIRPEYGEVVQCVILKQRSPEPII